MSGSGDCDFHLGDTGVDLTVEIPDCSDGAAASDRLDLTGATTTEITLKKPDDSSTTKVAVIVGAPTNGVIGYTTLAPDLDQTGTWKIQGHVVVGTLDVRTEVGEFIVRENL